MKWWKRFLMNLGNVWFFQFFSCLFCNARRPPCVQRNDEKTSKIVLQRGNLCLIRKITGPSTVLILLKRTAEQKFNRCGSQFISQSTWILRENESQRFFKDFLSDFIVFFFVLKLHHSLKSYDPDLGHLGQIWRFFRNIISYKKPTEIF